MSRQDFELIARTIASARQDFASNTAHARHAATMADALAARNPRFDRARFILACMPSSWVGTSKANVWERVAR